MQQRWSGARSEGPEANLAKGRAVKKRVRWVFFECRGVTGVLGCRIDTNGNQDLVLVLVSLFDPEVMSDWKRLASKICSLSQLAAVLLANLQ